MSTDAISITALSSEAEEVLAADAFNVDVEGFEGPLHLLLELARRQKIDILQIAMLPLAEQYLEFVNNARSKRIDIAADYLLMAAWLAYMKSRLMLPKPETDGDDETSGEDMAARLAFRLKRLDAMREAGEALMAGPVLNNVVFLRGAPEQPKVVKTTEYDSTLWHLTQAFGAIRTRRAKEAPHTVYKQFVLPLEQARQSLKKVIPQLHDWATLSSLSEQLGETAGDDVPPHSICASVFSATLELTRDGDVDIRQDEHFDPLYLRGISKTGGEGVHEPA